MLVAQTIRARGNGALLAKTSEMDLLMRLAGTTQISVALGKAGAKRGERTVIIASPGEARVDAFLRSLGFRVQRLPRRPLSTSDLDRVENAALLDAMKA